MEYHKDKYHESSFNPPVAAVGDKCDEVDSKASVGKEQTRNSELLDEPMLTNGSNEEILPISVLSVKKEVHKYIIEGQDPVEVAMSIRSVEPSVHEQREEEEDKNDPKSIDEDKSNSEDNEKESTEKRGVCSETSE